MSWPSPWLTSRSWCQELFDVGEGILNGFGQNTQTHPGAAETKELRDEIGIGVNQVWSKDDGIPWSAPQTRNGISNWSLLDASCLSWMTAKEMYFLTGRDLQERFLQLKTLVSRLCPVSDFQ